MEAKHKEYYVVPSILVEEVDTQWVICQSSGQTEVQVYPWNDVPTE